MSDYLVIHNSFRIVKDKFTVIAVYKTDQGDQTDNDPGMSWAKLWKGDLVVPMKLRHYHCAFDLCTRCIAYFLEKKRKDVVRIPFPFDM